MSAIYIRVYKSAVTAFDLRPVVPPTGFSDFRFHATQNLIVKARDVAPCPMNWIISTPNGINMVVLGGQAMQGRISVELNVRLGNDPYEYPIMLINRSEEDVRIPRGTPLGIIRIMVKNIKI
jgi:hypothetical protein